MSMCVLVPTRSRPANAQRLISAWRSTCATATLVLLVDDDDPELDAYKALDVLRSDDLIELVVDERLRIGGTLNKYAPRYAEAFDVVGFMGDDHLPVTPGWDATIEAASTPWTVVYGNDLLQGENLATQAFLGSGLVRTLGKFVPSGMTHLYLDNFWMTLGQRLGTLRYLPDVIIEHLHYLNGKAEQDALYAEVNSPSMYEADGQRWAEYASNGELAADLALVNAARAES